MNIELLTFGHELLDGRRVDTNTAWIGRYLSGLGLQIRFRQTTLDQKEDIVAAFRLALSRSDIIITTGGLGPTQDDITFESLADALNLPLEFYPDIEKRIQEKYAARGIPCPISNRRQAMLPQNGVPITNPHGTAPGLFMDVQGKMIFSFPGVPIEMEWMVENFFTPKIQSAFSFSKQIQQGYSLSGMAEARVEERIQELKLDQNDRARLHVAYTASQSLVDVTFSIVPHNAEEKDAILSRIDEKFFSAFSDHLIGWNKKTIQDHIVDLFQKKGWKLAIAESLTGGMITSNIVDVPGCSTILHQGLITYSYESKIQLLDVNPETLKKYGAVSVECVLEMARGIRNKTGVDFAMATTGIAGPSGATAQKPLGLTYIAWVGPKLEIDRNVTKEINYVKSTHSGKIVGPKVQNTDMSKTINLIEEHVFEDENGFAIVQGFRFTGDRKRNRTSATYRALMGLHSFVRRFS